MERRQASDSPAAGEAPLGIRFPEAFRDAAGSFMEMIRERNRVMNLVGPGETGRLWERHVLESAAFSLLLDPSKPVADIGSGAGFPGMVLAMLGFDVILLEPRRNRALFLEYAAGRLGLGNVSVIRSRLEDWPGTAPQFTARSLMPAGELVRLLEELGHSCSVTVRVPPGESAMPGCVRTLDLPVPPLDRPGVLVQYRIPIVRPYEAGSTRKATP
ncbi:MAG: 16S rRNA (guanine(527)-N(7))-methyltransferase RsmG [Candidatus Fermentibacter sp.]|nr:16S rRNA (guanine(527)-N(7))-methyltransferase RsmG [Candidatus Fermentibacter sp.]